MTCGAVVVAAGRSQRMGFNKTTAVLAGRRVVFRVLDVLESVPDISTIVVVASSENRVLLEEQLSSESYRTPIRCCLGGATRHESVRNGVSEFAEAVDLVLIHDAARPFITPELIRAGIQSAGTAGAAIAAIPVTDTVKLVDDTNVITRTIDRSHLFAAQTPQVFRRDWLERAYQRLDSSPETATFTDESSLLEWAGFDVHVFAGRPENIKLTTPFDVAFAEALLNRSEQVVS